jgi:hypothetical protein
MGWIRPTGSLAITTAASPYVAISGLSLTLVQAGMAFNAGSRTHKEGKDYGILGVNATAGAVGGIPANSIQLEENFPTTNASPGIPFIIDQLALQGNVQGTIMAQYTRILNRLEEVLGAGTAIDANSRMIDLNKGSFAAASQILWEVAGVDQFKVEQRTVGGFEYLILSATNDGTTWVDMLRFRRDTQKAEILALASPSSAVSAAMGVGAFPGGRLTLDVNQPVLAANQTGQGSIVYIPHVHNLVPIWDGNGFVMVPISILTNSFGGVAAVSTNYSLFVYLVGSTPTLFRFPWTSGVSRGTGAASAELELVNGIKVNKFAMTSGPAARYGTWVGDFGTDASGFLNMRWIDVDFDTVAAEIMIYNAYNREDLASRLYSSAGWSYAAAAYRAFNNKATARWNILWGELVNPAYTSLRQAASAGGGTAGLPIVGIGIDTVAVFSQARSSNSQPTTGTYLDIKVDDVIQPLLGRHYLACLEYSAASFTYTVTGGLAFTSQLLRMKY